jgi:molybdenum cofactor cytidylyltransferase
MRNVHAILLAAGESRRCPPNKLLLPWKDSTVLQSSADNLIASRVKSVLAVLGHDSEKARALLEGRRCRIALNPDYREGMGSSLACGVSSLVASGVLDQDDGIMLCLGDEPSIPVRLIDRLIREFAAGDRGIVVPIRRARRGHPTIFHRRYAADLLKAARAGGAREVIRGHPEDVREVETAAEEILLDIDTPEDYLLYFDRLRGAGERNGAGPKRVV